MSFARAPRILDTARSRVVRRPVFTGPERTSRSSEVGTCGPSRPPAAAGSFADRVGRRPTLLLALFATAGVVALLPALHSSWAIVGGVLAVGLFSHAYRPAAGATIGDIVPPEGRARAFGLLYWANNLGQAISMIVGGGLATVGFGPLFLADAATTFLFGLVVWRKVPETRPAVHPAGGGETAGYGAVREILRQPENFARVNNVLLLDGMHTSYVPEGKPLADGGVIDGSGLDSFIAFAKEAVAGKKIFVEGVPDANVPACQVCHGPEAKGNGQFPRLAGQLYPYIIKTLTNMDKERGQGGPG